MTKSGSFNFESRNSPDSLVVGSPIVAIELENGSRNVVLTYDDGPEPSGTHEVLTALADTKSTATFFVLLTRTRRTPSIVEDILKQGHEIALHGPDHQSTHAMSALEVETRTRDARHELEDLIGKSIRWFRPPYGNQSPESWHGVVRTGLESVHWSVQCQDWEDPVSEDYGQYMAEVEARQEPGAIVLCHDNCASESIDRANPVKDPAFNRERLARMIIGNFHQKGFACCSLENALLTGKPIRQPWPMTSS